MIMIMINNNNSNINNKIRATMDTGWWLCWIVIIKAMVLKTTIINSNIITMVDK